MSRPPSWSAEIVARPLGDIPDQQRTELLRARNGLAKAEERFRRAVASAIDAGGSYSVVADAAGLAKSTVQKIAAPSK